MGSLTLPASGLVIIDSVTLIYTIEKHPTYARLLEPLWDAVSAGTLNVATSELAVLETLVLPMRTANAALEADYRTALFGSELHLLPIGQATLLTAARLRAQHNLRTPDAIHAAAALEAGCALFVTNDRTFTRVPDLLP
jgi:predicted nucleic acid-binding protein